MEKSSILFSANTSDEEKEAAMNVLNIHRSLENDRYLGLPLLIGRNRSHEFRSIKERIWLQTQCWGGKFFSSAGKSIMLQSVAQAIPSYVMSCFRLLKSFIHELNIISANFWWGDRKKIHWKT